MAALIRVWVGRFQFHKCHNLQYPIVQCRTIQQPTYSTISIPRSEDGRYLVTGECGHLPSVRVWDIQVTGHLLEDWPLAGGLATS